MNEHNKKHLFVDRIIDWYNFVTKQLIRLLDERDLYHYAKL